MDIWITIKICGNKTNFISMNDSITGVVIENEEIARTMESIFDYIYGGGEVLLEKKCKNNILNINLFLIFNYGKW